MLLYSLLEPVGLEEQAARLRVLDLDLEVRARDSGLKARGIGLPGLLLWNFNGTTTMRKSLCSTCIYIYICAHDITHFTFLNNKPLYQPVYGLKFKGFWIQRLKGHQGLERQMFPAKPFS